LCGVLFAPLGLIVLDVPFRALLERRRRGDGRFGSCALSGRSFRLNDIDSGTHFLARCVALDPGVLERHILQGAQAVPAFFALDPIPIGPVPRCRAGHDEVETIPVRVFPGGDLLGDFQGFELPSHICSPTKPSAKPTEKTTVNAPNSGERR